MAAEFKPVFGLKESAGLECHSINHPATPQSQNPKKKRDWLFIGSLAVVSVSYLAQIFFAEQLASHPRAFVQSVYGLINTMWWGLLLGVFFVGLLNKIPREFVVSALGKRRGLQGILRATALGLTLDLCSHGILLVGMKLYERGASLGQTMAFLIASPWNSLSLTVILASLIGFPWTIAIVILSGVIAIISGLIFDRLEERGVLPMNPHRNKLPADFHFFSALKLKWRETQWSPGLFASLLWGGVKESKMILRWIFFGAILASLAKVLIPDDHFHAFFGPTWLGLALTLVAATVIEVCSEGSTPIAADLLTRGGAPGNAFAFLMAGVATDYTEILSLKETTRSWKIALFLPLVTIPQVILVSWIMNYWGH